MQKLSISDWLYYIPLAVYLIVFSFQTTMFHVPPIVFVVTRMFLYILLIAKIISDRYFSFWNIFLFSILLIVSILVWNYSGSTAIIELSLLIIASRNIKFDNIVTVYLISVGSVVLIAFLASMVGIIPNLQFFRGDVIRNSFGSIYPTDFAAHIFYLFLFASYLLKDKYQLGRLIASAILSYMVYKGTDARLDSFSIFIAGFLFYIQPRISFLKFSLQKAAVLVFPIFSFIAVYLVNGYSNTPFYSFLNTLVTSRISLAYRALQNYGWTLFGQPITFIGAGRNPNISARDYNFVDISFMYVLLSYGILVLVLFILLYMLLALRQSKNVYIAILMIMVAANSMIAHHWLEPHYNVLSLAIFASFEGYVKKEDNQLEEKINV